MGFQHMRSIVHEAASRKGGKIKVVKGVGKLPPDRRREIASIGGKAKHENKSNPDSVPKEKDSGDSDGFLERILTTLNEKDD